MGLKQVGAADIAAQRVQGFVARGLGHRTRRPRQETGAQRVAGEAGGMESGDLQREQFAAAERAGEAEGDQCPIAQPDQRGGAGGEQPRDEIGGGRGFSPGAVPSAWRMPRSTSRTAGLAVGGSRPAARW